jgi:hypothetical protein
MSKLTFCADWRRSDNAACAKIAEGIDGLAKGLGMARCLRVRGRSGVAPDNPDHGQPYLCGTSRLPLPNEYLMPSRGFESERFYPEGPPFSPMTAAMISRPRSSSRDARKVLSRISSPTGCMICLLVSNVVLTIEATRHLAETPVPLRTLILHGLRYPHL